MSPYDSFLAVRDDRSLIGNVELESSISTSTHYSYLYASEIIKRRFEMGEAAISKCLVHTYYYLIEVPNSHNIDLVLKILASNHRENYMQWYTRGIVI